MLMLAAGLVAVVAFTSVYAGDDKGTARDELRKMRKETLDLLYKETPQARQEIRKSAGYGVFSVAGAQFVFVGGSGGRGVVRDNLNGRDTYMKMGAVSAGLGVGFKDVRTVLIFESRAMLEEFLNKGWSFGGESAAVAKKGETGGGVGDRAPTKGIKVYQLTKTGLMAQGTVQGTKYWRDEELN